MDPLHQPSRLRRFLRIFLQLLLLAGLIAAGYFGWQKWKKTTEKGPEYATESAQIQALLIERTTATGTLQPLVSVQVGAQISGRIIKLNANYNSTVHKGDLLAELDATLIGSQVAQARANLTSAKAGVQHAEAALKVAQKSLTRTRNLYDKQLSTQADYDTATAQVELGKADLNNALANVVQAQAQLALQETNLAYCKIYSPVDGVVLSRSVDVGQTVAASLQAPVLFLIAKDLTDMQVHANVDEADIGKLMEEMHATFTVDAYRGQRFDGVVSQIRLSPQVVQNVVTYDAVVDVHNPGNKLKPGMTATVVFETAKRRDVLVVPNAALRFRPGADDKVADTDLPGTATQTGKETQPAEGGKKHKKKHGDVANLSGATTETTQERAPPSRVYRLEGQQLVAVEVVTGVSDGKFTEILTGKLKAGDEVVVRRVDKNQPGTPMAPGGAKGGQGGMPRKLF